MSEQKNLATIRAWVEAVNRNDVDAELACWAPDGEITVMPVGAVYRGTAQLRLAGQQSASMVAGQPIEGRKQITHLEAGEQWACVSYDVHATIRGPVILDGVIVIPEGSERTVVTKAHLMFEMRQGKFSRGIEYFDSSAMAQQLGIDHSLLGRLYSSLGSQTDLASAARPAPWPVEVATSCIEAWNTKNLDGFTALLAPQLSARNPLSPGEVTIAKEAVRASVQRTMAAFPDLHIEIHNVISENGAAAIEYIESATLASTKTSYTMSVSSFIKIDPAGQITHLHNYWDTHTYFQQLNITRETLTQILGLTVFEPPR